MKCFFEIETRNKIDESIFYGEMFFPNKLSRQLIWLAANTEKYGSKRIETAYVFFLIDWNLFETKVKKSNK